MERDELIAALAKIVAGLQVPLSINGALLGAAAEPLREVLGALGFGWTNAETVREWLAEQLSVEDAAAST